MDQVPVNGKPRYESSGSGKKRDALRLLNKRKKEIDDRRITAADATVNDLLQLYLADQRQKKRNAYKAAESYVRLHLQPAFGKIKAEALTTAMISRFIEQKQAQGLAIVSWKGYSITEVKTAWQKARVRAGVPDLLLHDLRRTAVRNMIRAGVPEKASNDDQRP